MGLVLQSLRDTKSAPAGKAGLTRVGSSCVGLLCIYIYIYKYIYTYKQRERESPIYILSQSGGLASFLTPFQMPHNKWGAHVAERPDTPLKPCRRRRSERQRKRERERGILFRSQTITRKRRAGLCAWGASLAPYMPAWDPGEEEILHVQ